ncbi:hypothetical protein HBB16_06575 [Pseudonocardia sp. MCCB 268]|nr:hypothetical protein [Pseudonocardia cytotoxica]
MLLDGPAVLAESSPRLPNVTSGIVGRCGRCASDASSTAGRHGRHDRHHALHQRDHGGAAARPRPPRSRLGLPATAAPAPFCDWPERLVRRRRAGHYLSTTAATGSTAGWSRRSTAARAAAAAEEHGQPRDPVRRDLLRCSAVNASDGAGGRGDHQ